MKKLCKACGEEFYTLSYQQIYCFDCKGNSSKQRRLKKLTRKQNNKKEYLKLKKETPTCTICCNPVSFPRRLYCSDACAEKARKRKYIENTPKRIKYYFENCDRIREYQRDYYYKHCTEINARARQMRRKAKEDK